MKWHPRHAKVQASACDAIRYLASKNRTISELILMGGGMEAVRDAQKISIIMNEEQKEKVTEAVEVLQKAKEKLLKKVMGPPPQQ